ncbi:TPA: YadA-like family protein, partial [Escherichia coli]
MSKKLAKTVLSTAVAGVLFGVSFATLAETETEVDSYSVIKLDGADRSKLDREKFQIEVYKKDGKDKDGKDYGSILYGIRPDVMAKKGQELYKFDNQGYVYFEDNKGVERKIYDEGVGEFVRSLKKTGGPVHGMDEGEIRGLTLRIENAKQLLSEGAELKSTTAELKSTTAELKSTTTELQSALKSDTTKNSVALGANSVITRDNEVYIGYKTESEYGTRVLGGLSDGTRNSDAATVGQLNRKVGGVYDDVKARITVESEKQKKYTDQKTSEVNEKV